MIEKYKPTLLIDEADTFLRGNEELRGVLNRGHTRSGATILHSWGKTTNRACFQRGARSDRATWKAARHAR